MNRAALQPRGLPPVNFSAWMRTRRAFTAAVDAGPGLVCLVGPEGSGKSYTLHLYKLAMIGRRIGLRAPGEAAEAGLEIDLVDNVDAAAAEALAAEMPPDLVRVLSIRTDEMDKLEIVPPEPRIVRMRPMSAADVRGMVKVRRTQFALEADEVAEPAVAELVRLSNGTPRRIDRMFGAAVRRALLENASCVTADYVASAAHGVIGQPGQLGAAMDRASVANITLDRINAKVAAEELGVVDAGSGSEPERSAPVDAAAAAPPVAMSPIPLPPVAEPAALPWQPALVLSDAEEGPAPVQEAASDAAPPPVPPIVPARDVATMSGRRAGVPGAAIARPQRPSWRRAAGAAVVLSVTGLALFAAWQAPRTPRTPERPAATHAVSGQVAQQSVSAPAPSAALPASESAAFASAVPGGSPAVDRKAMQRFGVAEPVPPTVFQPPSPPPAVVAAAAATTASPPAPEAAPSAPPAMVTVQPAPAPPAFKTIEPALAQPALAQPALAQPALAPPALAPPAMAPPAMAPPVLATVAPAPALPAVATPEDPAKAIRLLQLARAMTSIGQLDDAREILRAAAAMGNAEAKRQIAESRNP